MINLQDMEQVVMTYKNAVDIIKTAIFQSQARAAKALYTIILQNDGQRVIAAFFHACPRALSDVAATRLNIEKWAYR